MLRITMIAQIDQVHVALVADGVVQRKGSPVLALAKQSVQEKQISRLQLCVGRVNICFTLAHCG